MKAIKDVVIILSLLLVSALLVETIYTVHIIRPKVYETVSNIRDTSTTAKDFFKFQTDVIRSPAYQKNIEHASEAGDLAAKTIAQFARQTLPRVNKSLDDLSLLEAELTRSAGQTTGTIGELSKFIADTNFSVNQGLLPEVTSIAHKLGATTDEMSSAIHMAAEKTGLSLDEINRRLADPRIDVLMDQVVATGANVQATSAEFRDAARHAPEIAASLDKIAHESSKFARVTLIANVLSTLARAFLP